MAAATGSGCWSSAPPQRRLAGALRPPVVLVETFVDPEQFCGTVYSANGWEESGVTDGFGRVRRDFYVQHNKPKRLFARELCRHARRSLQAGQLKPTLAGGEAKTRPRSPHSPAQIRSLVEHLKSLPDYRARIGVYPLWSLVALGVLAHLCGAPRGPKEWSLFGKGLSQTQRRALGIRRQAEGYPAPGPSTFWRLMTHVDANALEKIFLRVQAQLRGPAPPEELIVLDGQQPRHGGGPSVLTAVTGPSPHYLGSALLDQKTNENPSRANSSGSSIWTAAKSASMPSTPRTRPHASWCSNTVPTIC